MMGLLAMVYARFLRFGTVPMPDKVERYCQELPRGTVVLQNRGYDG